ncbi:lipase [Trametopsis cervina]|nr:lipase [Trametopsis cervina]
MHSLSHSFLTFLFTASTFLDSCYAAALPQQLTVLSQTQVSSFQPYAYYAAAAYCKPSAILSWSCGTNCQSKSFHPVASGGDGVVTQYWYVGYDEALQSVIVGNEGTKPTAILPLIEDIEISLKPLSPSLFPGIPSSVLVHQGFRDAHARTASAILDAVNATLSLFLANQVTLVGHSLGGAISLLSTLHLSLHLPPTTSLKTITFGLPRIGNQAFADLIDSHAPSFTLTRITNARDPVPILPGRFLGFRHPSGELHVDARSGAWVVCPGQENTSSACTDGAVPNIFMSSEGDHDGPYAGVRTKC